MCPDMFERFSPEAHQVLTLARNDAVASGSSFVEPEHILLALLRSNRALADSGWAVPCVTGAP